MKISRLSIAVLLMLALLLSLPLTTVASTTSVSADYGANRKFIAAIKPPEWGSIPISNRAELAAMELYGSYHLVADIDLSDGAWVPIGILNNHFSGTFDGQGHVIHGLTINESYDDNSNRIPEFGLFGYAASNISYRQDDAVIKNLGLEDINISVTTTISRPSLGSDTYVGGISGAGGIISNCYVTGKISLSSIYEDVHDVKVYAGGISGANSNINNCYSVVSIYASATRDNSTISSRSAFSYTGGIVGYNGAGFSIENSYSVSSITAESMNRRSGEHAAYAGGICGYLEGNSTVRNSYWNIDNMQMVNGSIRSNDDKKGIGYGVGQTKGLTTEQMKQQSSYNNWDFTSDWAFKPGVNDDYPILRAFHEFPSSWAEVSVNAAITANLVPRTLQSKYTQVITRAEFCALAVALYENIKGEITERSIFTDTNDVNVQKAAYIGVVSGVGDNKFDPNGTLTREQAAVMLARLTDAIGKPFTIQAPTFADNGNISSWAVDGVGQVQAAGIMSGMGDNRFAPQDPYTREQSIITIMRVFNVVK